MLVGLNAAHSGSSSTYVYLGHTPERFLYEAEDVLSASYPASAIDHGVTRAAAVERQGRWSGGAGAHFTPALDSSVVRVEVAVASFHEGISPGLPPWAAKGVLAGIASVADLSSMAALGPGLLYVHWGWWHAVDSSEWGFQDLGKRLIPLLLLPSTATETDVMNAWEAQRNEREAKLTRLES